MRILMVSPVLGDAFGQERVMRDSAGLLRAAGHEVFFLGQKTAGSVPEVDGLACVPEMLSLGLLSSPGQVRRVKAEVLDKAQSFRPDVVHLIDQCDARLMTALADHYPLVITAHTVAPTCPNSTRLIGDGGACQEKSGWSCLSNHRRYGCLSFMKNDVQRAMGIADYRRRRESLQAARAVFAISRYVESTLLHDGWPAEKVRLVYNPVFVPRASDASRTRASSGASVPMVLCASRLAVHKGVGHLIQALKPLEGLAWELRICGDGPERARLESLVAGLGLGERIRFLGQTSFEQTQSLMREARCLAQPNIGPEPFGLSVAEASALGVPVVGFDIPALNEIVVHERSGLLAPRGNVSVLTQHLELLLRDPQLAARLGSEGPGIIAQRFSPDAHLQATVDAYSDAVGISRRAA